METTHPKESTMLEIWKDIPEYEGFYQVSNMGQVKSFIRRSLSKILKPFPTSKGYMGVELYGKWYAVHRLVLIAFVGTCPEGMECLHSNDIKSDNRIENLKWGTRSQNQLDRYNRRGMPTGESHWNAKLNNYQIRVIRRCFDFGVTGKFTSKIFKISKNHASLIKLNQARKRG